jgi:hypothetical protein
MKLVYLAEPFGVGTLFLASKSLDIHVEPDNGVRGQLMQVDFKLFQNFTYMSVLYLLAMRIFLLFLEMVVVCAEDTQ